MKLFGEFLIEKKAVTEEQLLKGLIYQLEKQPSISGVAFQLKILPTSQFLSVLNEQAKRKIGFVEAAQGLGFWTPHMASQIDEALAKSRPPLGQILVEQGSLSVDALSHLLDEFLDGIQKSDLPRERVESSQAKSVQSNEQNSPMVLSGATIFLESLNENFFSETQALLEFTTGWTSLDGFEAEQILKTLQQTFRSLQGAARAVSLPILEKIFALLEIGVRSLVEMKQKPDPADLERWMNQALQGFQLAWKMRQELERTGQLGGHLNQEQNQVVNQLAEFARETSEWDASRMERKVG